VTFEPLTKCDISRLALLQTSVLPGAMAAQFGTRYARCFYRYVARSVDEVLLVRRERGEIVAFCVASLGIHSLPQRLVTHTPLAFYALLRVIRPQFWRLFINVACDVFTASSNTLPAIFSRLPEVILLACDPEARGRGHASHLLENAEIRFHDLGIREYVVRTFDDDNNLAAKFYLRKGFTVIARFVSHGIPFRLMRRAIPTRP
jgi:ribosomal protein S18 acetylase RimI-like enzyme